MVGISRFGNFMHYSDNFYKPNIEGEKLKQFGLIEYPQYDGRGNRNESTKVYLSYLLQGLRSEA